MLVYALVRALQVVTLLAVALTVIKLYRTGLRSRYPVFFWYFCFWLANASWPLFVSVRSDLYYSLWVGTEFIDWVFYVLVVLELSGLVLEKYRGLYTLGRWVTYGGIALATAVSVVSVLPGLNSGGIQQKTLRLLLAADRGITLGLAIFLLLMMAFLRGYPVHLSRNVILHARLYTTFFVSNTLDSLLAHVFGRQIFRYVDLCLMSIAAACVLTWLLRLNPAGEETVAPATAFTQKHEERILGQLEALNAAMLRMARSGQAH
jgi:hypothetical protein